MNKESIQKKIDHEINIKNNLWTAFMISVGGTISLMLAIDSLFKLVFIISGFILSIILLNGYFQKETKIESLIKNLEQL